MFNLFGTLQLYSFQHRWIQLVCRNGGDQLSVIYRNDCSFSKNISYRPNRSGLKLQRNIKLDPGFEHLTSLISQLASQIIHVPNWRTLSGKTKRSKIFHSCAAGSTNKPITIFIIPPNVVRSHYKLLTQIVFSEKG